jgi:hypothetical protein
MRLAAKIVEEPVSLLGSRELVRDDAQESWPHDCSRNRLLGHASGIEVNVIDVAVHGFQGLDLLRYGKYKNINYVRSRKMTEIRNDRPQMKFSGVRKSQNNFKLLFASSSGTGVDRGIKS